MHFSIKWLILVLYLVRINRLVNILYFQVKSVTSNLLKGDKKYDFEI